MNLVQLDILSVELECLFVAQFSWLAKKIRL